MNVALFCASAEGLPADVVAAAGSLGQWIGRQGHTLLYGGVRKGLMEVTAQAVKAGVGVKEIDVKALQEALRQGGAFIGY